MYVVLFERNFRKILKSLTHCSLIDLYLISDHNFHLLSCRHLTTIPVGNSSQGDLGIVNF